MDLVVNASTGHVSRGGSSAILFAARRGDVESVGVLLDRGAAIEERGADGYSPLLLAAHSGHVELTRYLLGRGADPNASGVGYSALHTAVLRGDTQITAALIKAGAATDARITKPAPMERFTDKWMVLPIAVVGYTPCQLAAKYVEVAIIRILLTAGCDPNDAAPDGTTPLMDATGVNLNANGSTDRRGRTVDVALVSLMNKVENGVLDAAKLLVDAGADVTAVNRAGDTALHGAGKNGLRQVFSYLESLGADPELRNKRGKTPRLLLASGGDTEF